MAKPWDDAIKRLIHLRPEAFVRLFLPEAHFIEALPPKLRQEEMEMDNLFRTEFQHHPLLMDVEVQTRYDARMPERLLRYNIITRMQHNAPVVSCVLHLLDDTPIHPSPFTWEVAGKQERQSFSYHVIELSQYTPESIIALGEVTLLPLLPFTKGGKSREVLTHMFRLIEQDTTLDKASKRELIGIAFTFASLVLQRGQDAEPTLDWLIRRFHDMDDLLIDTPIFQEIRKEGFEKGLEQGLERGLEQGLEQGLERGLEQGLLLGLRRSIVRRVNRRFPNLTALAQQQVEQMGSEEILNDVLTKIIMAQNQEEAQEILLHWQENIQ